MSPRETRPAARVLPYLEKALRARAHVTIGLPAALLLAVIAGCGNREEAPPAAPATAPMIAAPARPTSVRIEGRLRDLGTLRAALPPMLAAVAPTRASELLAAACALPAPLHTRIADDSRIAFAFARASEDEPLSGAFAATVRIDAGPSPLGDGTTLVDDAEDGVRWLGAAPAEGRAALALVGDALVCAESAALARTLGPYVARTLLPRITEEDPAPRAPVHASLLPGAVSGDLRRFFSAELARATIGARQGAARQAARSADNAALGDLGDAAVALQTSLRPLVESLAGAGAGSITIESDDAQLVLRATVDAPAGSPLAAALVSLPAVPRSTLASLPAGAAVAAVLRADPTAPWAVGDALRAALAAAAGAALPDADGATVEAALASIGAARGPTLVVAAGVREGQSFVQLGATGSTAAPDPTRLQAALDTPFLRGAVAKALTCEAPKGRTTVSRPVAVGEASARALRVCGSAAAPDSDSIPTQLVLATHPSAWSLYVSRSTQAADANQHAAEAAVALAQVGAAAAAGTALAALPEHFRVGVVVRPAALAGLFSAPASAEGVGTAASPNDDDALFFALDHDAHGAHLTLIAPGAAIAGWFGAVARNAGAPR
jgi:hypothetical protein